MTQDQIDELDEAIERGSDILAKLMLLRALAEVSKEEKNRTYGAGFSFN
jgi:hypothetical protein